MKWVWIRHGETDANRRGCYLGHLDAPLNAEGKRQAQQLRGKAPQATIVYSSDLSRCVQTAELATGHRPIHTTEALRELNFGAWDGLRYEQLMETEPSKMSAWIDDPFTIAPPDGETLVALGSRIDAWVERNLRQHGPDDVIWVFSHGGPIRWMLCQWLYGNRQKYWDAPGAPHGGGVINEWDGQRWGQPRWLEMD